jgi:hypothetical protein
MGGSFTPYVGGTFLPVPREPEVERLERFWLPTKRGVTLKPEDLAELIAALQEAEKQARAAGLLTTKQEAA